MSLAFDLATIWAFIIAFAVFVYVVMDGFDLGLGILFPLFPAKADRDMRKGRDYLRVRAESLSMNDGAY